MDLSYNQVTGEFTNENSEVIAKGWAGHGVGKNAPEHQMDHELGPLPQGVYAIGPWGDWSTQNYPKHLGPLIASLTQVEGESYGRDGFFIHGPGGPDPLQSSKGCIEVYRIDREHVAMVTRGPGDRLKVVGPVVTANPTVDITPDEGGAD